MNKGLLLGLSMFASGATFAQECVNKETLNINDKTTEATIETVTGPTSNKLAKTITFKDAKDSKFSVTGGTGITNCAFTPISGNIASDETTYSGYLNITHESGIGATISRFDDFGEESAGSRFTKMGLTYNKKFGLSENRDIYFKGDVSYVNFDNKFTANEKDLKLNEFMGVVEIDLNNGKKYFLNLSLLYNAFLNGETPHNMVARLKAGTNLGENTTLYSEGWYKVDAKGEKKVTLGLGVEQKFGQGFSAWLEGLHVVGSSHPKLLFGLKKNFNFKH